MDIIINKEKFVVIKNNKEFQLTRKEFEILDLFCSVPGKVFSRKYIFQKLWTDQTNSKERTVDVHILNIRKKLGEEIIRTIKGVGYKCNCG